MEPIFNKLENKEWEREEGEVGAGEKEQEEVNSQWSLAGGVSLTCRSPQMRVLKV